MEDKIKNILIVLGVIGVLIFGYLIYQKVIYEPTTDNIVGVEDIEDKNTPEQQEEEEITKEKPDPIVYEEGEEVVKEPEEKEMGINEIRRDPIVLDGNQPDNNDKIFNAGDIEEITDIVEIIEEDTRPVEEDLDRETRERKEKERQERNIGYADARLEDISISSSEGHINLSNNIPKKGLVIVYWTTVIDGGADTIDKWINYYNSYKDEVEFIFLNRGFEVEQQSIIKEYIGEKGWDIPLYMDNMLSFSIVHDMKLATEGFYINKDGFLMGREKSTDLKGVESGIKGMVNFYDKNKGVWDY